MSKAAFELSADSWRSSSKFLLGIRKLRVLRLCMSSSWYFGDMCAPALHPPSWHSKISAQVKGRTPANTSFYLSSLTEKQQLDLCGVSWFLDTKWWVEPRLAQSSRGQRLRPCLPSTTAGEECLQLGERGICGWEGVLHSPAARLGCSHHSYSTHIGNK